MSALLTYPRAAKAAFHCTLSAAIVALTVVCAGSTFAGEVEEAESRLFDAVRFLSSDELGGRGLGTDGINVAADYIAEQFEKLGLVTDLYEGKPFQTFSYTIGAELGEKNEVTLVGPPTDDAPDGQRLPLKMSDDFMPLALGGSGKLDLPLVFVGYGITAPDAGYDDYAGIDVEGKAVVILRHEPQQDNPHSAFDGQRDSPYAPFKRKISNAYEHGAAAVIFLTDAHEIESHVARRERRFSVAIDELSDAQTEFKKIEDPTVAQIEEHQAKVDDLLEEIRKQGERLREEYDPVLDFQRAGPGGDGRDFPVMHCRRGVWDDVVKTTLESDLASLEEAIDHGPEPKSGELKGWRLVGEVTVNRRETEVKNVVGVLEGEGPLAKETIVIGAHYDHLGMGGPGSLAPGKREIHNGADDNASGTAALIEIARILSTREKKLPRRIVFIAFTAEESGLIGSAHYVREPLVPMEDTIAMLNLDMVGRLDDEKLIIQGTQTADEFVTLVDQLEEKYDFDVTKRPGGTGPSDHSSFYLKNVPVMHFFTGTHRDYHRPSDDYDKINSNGMRRISQMVADIVVALAEVQDPPRFKHVASRASGGGDAERPYFGSIPDFAQEGEGYALSGVAEDGPAGKAGLKGGDIIIRLGDSRIGNLEDFDSALRKYKGGDKVPVVVKRGNEELTMEVTLDPPRN